SHDGEPPHHIESVSPQCDVVNPSVEAGGAEGSDSLTGVDVDLDYPADVLAVPLAEAAIDPSRLPVTGGKDPKHLAVHVGIEPSQDLVVALLKGNDVLTGEDRLVARLSHLREVAACEHDVADLGKAPDI